MRAPTPVSPSAVVHTAAEACRARGWTIVVDGGNLAKAEQAAAALLVALGVKVAGQDGDEQDGGETQW